MHLNRDTLIASWGSSGLRKTLSHWHVWDLLYTVIVFFLDSVWLERAHPFERQFTVNDITISHPMAAHERVPGAMLLSWSMFFPPVVIAVVTLLLTPVKFKLYVAYISGLCYYTALFTTVMVTDVLKNWIGRCRPDFLARCKPKAEALPDVLYLAKDICTTYNPKGAGWNTLMDGFRTTPSGHSSMAFTLGGFLSLFLLTQLNAFRPRYSVWRFVLGTSPLYGSFYVALSRTQDYRHHFVDVFLGSLLGSIVVSLVWRRFYPALTAKHAYVPLELLQDDALDEDEWFETEVRGKYAAGTDLEGQFPVTTPSTPFQ